MAISWRAPEAQHMFLGHTFLVLTKRDIALCLVAISPVRSWYCYMEFAALDQPRDSWKVEKDAIDGARRMRTDAEAQTTLIDDIIGMLDRTLQRDDSQEVK